MKQFYTAVFSLDNTKKEQNFIIDINESLDLQSTENQISKSVLDRIIFQPRQEVVDQLFEMLETGKI